MPDKYKQKKEEKWGEETRSKWDKWAEEEMKKAKPKGSRRGLAKASREKTGDPSNKAQGNRTNQSRTHGKTGKRRKKGPGYAAAQFLMGFSSIMGPCVIAVIAAMIMRSAIMVNVTVPTGSMMNTINPGDLLITSRVSYVLNEPERGDIIVFYAPDDEDEYYIKRIIGLPGETVEIIGNEIYIDGSNEPLQESYLPEEWQGDGNYCFEVPEGSYFVMGDNRNNSYDARYWENTYVTEDKIIAKALFRYIRDGKPDFGWLSYGDGVYK